MHRELVLGEDGLVMLGQAGDSFKNLNGTGLVSAVVDHLDVHARQYGESVRFYETVLAPLGIPKLFERDSEACFTHVNVVDRQPPTSDLHLCFCARSKAEVDAFHAAGV